MKSEQGFAFTESLVSILIFSIGLLGVLGFRSVAVHENTESKIRTHASFLASSLVGEMWANRANLSAYNASGAAVPPVMNGWYSAVRRELPGSDQMPPIVQVSNDGQVVIVMRWRVAGGDLRQYRMTTQILDP